MPHEKFFAGMTATCRGATRHNGQQPVGNRPDQWPDQLCKASIFARGVVNLAPLSAGARPARLRPECSHLVTGPGSMISAKCRALETTSTNRAQRQPQQLNGTNLAGFDLTEAPRLSTASQTLFVCVRSAVVLDAVWRQARGSSRARRKARVLPKSRRLV
jgi:hypothetical protein